MMRNNIKSYEDWKLYEKAMKAQIPWAPDEDTQIYEGKISNLDIMAQESETFEDFTEAFKSYIEEEKIEIEIDEETTEWLQDLYDQAKSNN